MSKKQDHHENWKRCDISHLVHHFHKFNKKKSVEHHERLDALHLKQKDLAELFAAPKKVKSFNIWMGLDSEKSSAEEFTFRPIIEVKLEGKKEPISKVFHHGMWEVGTPIQVNEVPEVFKDWMVKNWMELDSSLVDDAFVAFLPDEVSPSSLAKPPKPSLLRRLFGYHFTEDINSEFLSFIKNQKSIDGFILHLGIDKNRVEHKDRFNFTPVFEIKSTTVATPKNVVDTFSNGFRNFLLATDGDKFTTNTYVEYVLPCPSTCP